MPKKHSLICISLSVALLLAFCCAGSFWMFRSADKDFQDFSFAMFSREVASNSITLHYTLKNPSEYGISSSSLTLGSYPASPEETCACAENYLELLHQIPYQELNEKNQLTYRILEDSLEETLACAPYTLYDEPLSPLTGIQAQLPILLSEYQFYSLADADTYLDLLETVPEYFDSLISFEQARADAGLFMTADSADALVDECISFLELGNENYLYSTFETRISELEACNQETADSYIEQNRNALETYVLPSYRKLADALKQLRDTGKNPGGLCGYPEGTGYYEHLVRQETGSDRAIPALKKLILSQIQDDLLSLQSLLLTPDYGGGSSAVLADFSLQDSNPASILAGLKENLDGLFPEPPNVNTDIKFVQQEMEEYLSPAFYMIPAIDNTQDNTIYINASQLSDDLSLFTTLAHEGYPGHLYQNIYYASTDPDPIRSLLGCGGYTEGWATYTEMISYYFTGLSDSQAGMHQHNASVLLGLYALADIGIHYEGWALTDTLLFFRNYGISDAEAVERIYHLILCDPANYLKYYIGYVEFLELKKEAVRSWGEDFSQLRFHKAVLDAGPAPFYILKDAVL